MKIKIDPKEELIKVKDCSSDALTFHFAAGSVGISEFYAIPKHSNYVYASVDKDGNISNPLAYQILTDRGYTGEFDLLPIDTMGHIRFIFPQKQQAAESEQKLLETYNNKFTRV